MYVPRPFRVDDRDQLVAFMQQYGFAILVSNSADSSGESNSAPVATHLPVSVSVQADDQLRLLLHLARANPQVSELRARPNVLVIFHGPHAYVSPTAYDAVQSVPTWDYAAVHAYGTARLVDEPAALTEMLALLIAQHEPSYQSQWDSLPERYRAGMLSGIVGVEVDVTRLEGSFKLSQNKTGAERERVATKLDGSDDGVERATARLIRDTL